MIDASLLPPSSTKLERALDLVSAKFKPAKIVPSLWNAETCPEAILPYLAWASSVDEWDANWSVERKRNAITSAREIHKHKGTPSAIRYVLATVGQSDADLIERSDFIRCDGSTLVNGTRTCGGRWATFRIILKSPITITDAQRIKRMIASSKRNCVWLQAVDFSAASFRCDGSFNCEGTVTCGTVDTQIN